MELLLALQFLTMVPITIRGKVEEINLARAMAYFPAVGVLIGLASAILYYILGTVLPISVSILFTMAFVIMFTGNMHLDGLMDTVDGIYSGRPRERVLEIMKDSRVGSHGVAAGVLALLIRYVLLTEIQGDMRLTAFIIIPVLGRWAQVYGAANFPYARIGGGTGSFADRVGGRELLWASLTVLIVVFSTFFIRYHFWSYQMWGVVPMMIKTFTLIGGSASAAILAGRYISRKLGGLTGDTYGLLNEITEIAALIAFLLI